MWNALFLAVYGAATAAIFIFIFDRLLARIGVGVALLLSLGLGALVVFTGVSEMMYGWHLFLESFAGASDLGRWIWLGAWAAGELIVLGLWAWFF